MKWQQQTSGKKNEKEPKNVYILNLSFHTKINDLMIYLVYDQTNITEKNVK